MIYVSYFLPSHMLLISLENFGFTCCKITVIDTLPGFQNLHAFVNVQAGRNLKCLQTGNGREFTNAEFQKFCDSHGIKKELIALYTPSCCSVAERTRLWEEVRCMLSTTYLPWEFWEEAINSDSPLQSISSHSTKSSIRRHLLSQMLHMTTYALIVIFLCKSSKTWE